MRIENEMWKGMTPVDLNALADLAEERGERERSIGCRLMAGWSGRAQEALAKAAAHDLGVAGINMPEEGLWVIVINRKRVSHATAFRHAEFGVNPLAKDACTGGDAARLRMAVQVIAAAAAELRLDRASNGG